MIILIIWFSQLFNLGGEDGGRWGILFWGCSFEAQNKDNCTALWFPPKAQDSESQCYRKMRKQGDVTVTSGKPGRPF